MEEVQVEMSLTVSVISSAECRKAKKVTNIAIHNIIWLCHCRLSKTLKESSIERDNYWESGSPFLAVEPFDSSKKMGETVKVVHGIREARFDVKVSDCT